MGEVEFEHIINFSSENSELVRAGRSLLLALQMLPRVYNVERVSNSHILYEK